MDIKNITIVPHPEKDNYVMNIVQGKDTLRIDVLPNLKNMKARKIQKWHKKKYNKYSKKLQERLLYWNKLDSMHLNYFTSFEKKLSKFREEVIANEVDERDVKKAAKSINADEYKTTIIVNKTGLYQFGEKLLLNKGKATPLTLKISGRNHYAKYLLIRNPKNNQTYWQTTKRTILSELGQNYIYSKVGPKIYVGKYDGSRTIHLSKLDSK